MFRRISKFLLYSIGHRGFFLLLLGLAFVFYGVSVIRQPGAYAIYPYRFIPWDVWGWIWVGTGITSFIGVPRVLDRSSFLIATTVSALWSIRWFYVAHSLPHANLWSTGLTWAVITGIILIVSTWPEVHIRFVKDEPRQPDDCQDAP